MPIIETSTPTPVEKISFKGRSFYVKRDDLVSDFYSGNKYRKLYSLIKSSDSSIKELLSYGGSQSNAMVAIAHLAKEKEWKFTYYIKKLPLYLKNNISGNLAQALECGMKLIELDSNSYSDLVKNRVKSSGDKIFIPQGGADKIASQGVKILAEEIEQWASSMGIDSLMVATPSGTGTTALYLREHLPLNYRVLTTPIAGDRKFLEEQWRALSDNKKKFPAVIETLKRYRFAKPYKEFLQVYRLLKNEGIEFDLIYAPKMWMALYDYVKNSDSPVLYIHSGGVSGNKSQFERYSYQNII